MWYFSRFIKKDLKKKKKYVLPVLLSNLNTNTNLKALIFFSHPSQKQFRSWPCVTAWMWLQSPAGNSVSKGKKLVLSRDSRTSLGCVLKKNPVVFNSFFFNNNMSILTYFYGFSKLQTFPVHCSCFYFFAFSIFTNIYQNKEKEKKQTHSTPSDGAHSPLFSSLLKKTLSLIRSL